MLSKKKAFLEVKNSEPFIIAVMEILRENKDGKKQRRRG